ncbi:hypothetical protein F4818DRAFT_185509 [Hypoxylon cercidicola]|nr:hypothetical protein F4818DRAFT_185509 [Hypoxylon cercidicola]
MSFLHVTIPTKTLNGKTLNGLKHDIHGQFEAGHLQATEFSAKSEATPGLTQLICTLERRLNRYFETYSLINVDSRELYHLDEAKGEACVLCLQNNDSGPAVWTDSIRECPIEDDTVLLCGEGYLYAEGLKRGGIYLVLWPPVHQHQKCISLAREPLKTQERSHIPVHRQTELERCQKALAYWEKADAEELDRQRAKMVQQLRKRESDLQSKAGNENAGTSVIDEPPKDTADNRRQGPQGYIISPNQPVEKADTAQGESTRKGFPMKGRYNPASRYSRLQLALIERSKKRKTLG